MSIKDNRTNNENINYCHSRLQKGVEYLRQYESFEPKSYFMNGNMERLLQLKNILVNFFASEE